MEGRAWQPGGLGIGKRWNPERGGRGGRSQGRTAVPWNEWGSSGLVLPSSPVQALSPFPLAPHLPCCVLLRGGPVAWAGPRQH